MKQLFPNQISKTYKVLILLVLLGVITLTSIGVYFLNKRNYDNRSDAAEGQIQTFAGQSIALTSPELVNPMRGQYSWNGNEIIQMPAPSMDEDRRIEWKELEVLKTGGNKDNPADYRYDFTKIENELVKAKNAGKKFSFRVRTLKAFGNACDSTKGFGLAIPEYAKKYTWLSDSDGFSRDASGGDCGTYIPDYNNEEFLQRIFSLMKAMGEKYNGDPRIGWLNNGWYGQYGEWAVAGNTYDGAPTWLKPITQANAQRLVDEYAYAFPDNQIVMMLYRQFNGAVFKNALNRGKPYPIREIKDSNGVVIKKIEPKFPIGWRQDCLGAEYDSGDNLVYDSFPKFFSQSWWSTPDETGWSPSQNWKYAPIVTEYCQILHKTDRNGVRMGKAFEWAARDVRDFHISLVSGGNIDLPWDWYTSTEKANAARAAKTAGYRYELKELKYPATINSGSPVSISSIWNNAGVAPAYERWDVKLQLKNPTTQAVVWEGKIDRDLKTILPGALVNSNHSVTFNAPAGTYNLNLIVKDPANYRKPMQLAIGGKQADGGYSIGTITVQGGTVVTATPLPTATSTPKPTVTATATPKPSPTVIPSVIVVDPMPTTNIIGLKDGDTVKGKMTVEYKPTDLAQTDKVTFYINNDLKNTENSSPFYLGGDTNGTVHGYDTSRTISVRTNEDRGTKLQDGGGHVLKTVWTKKSGEKVDTEIKFNVDNIDGRFTYQGQLMNINQTFGTKMEKLCYEVADVATGVSFYIDGRYIEKENSSPYCLGTSDVYDSSKLLNGTHTLRASFAKNGRTITSDISFIIKK